MSYIQKSPWLIHFDGLGCTGCNMEVQACFAPQHDLEQFGVKVTENPEQADVLLVTGAIDEEQLEEIKRIYERMLPPKAVVAVGVCACGGGIFEGFGRVFPGIDSAVPVNVYVPGCAARPEAIIDGILRSFDSENDFSEGDSSAEEDLTEGDSMAEEDLTAAEKPDEADNSDETGGGASSRVETADSAGEEKEESGDE